MGGSRPKPSELRLLQGNPGHRSINKDEPKGEPLKCKPPSWLNKDAKKFYRELFDTLSPMRVLKESDKWALEMLALELSVAKAAYEGMVENGFLRLSSLGEEKQSPYNPIKNGAIQNVRILLNEFGLTPASRTKIIASATEKEVDPLDSFLSRGKRDS